MVNEITILTVFLSYSIHFIRRNQQMADISNLNTLLYSGSSIDNTTTLVGSIKIEPPELKNAKVESTQHGSTTYKTYVYSRQIDPGDLKLTTSMTNAVMLAMSGSLTGSTQGYFKIMFPVSSGCMVFPALVTSFKPGAADSQQPTLQTCDVILSPSGSITFS
jgi:hypothetical protein